jgi:hypothetical protein
LIFSWQAFLLVLVPEGCFLQIYVAEWPESTSKIHGGSFEKASDEAGAEKASGTLRGCNQWATADRKSTIKNSHPGSASLSGMLKVAATRRNRSRATVCIPPQDGGTRKITITHKKAVRE